ncbi:MAG: hypothetical protein JW932_08735 [Deltaproteobacteria bacterium]|nr:hypothetical protein [Deltaproteobacteria bacterium]
MVNQANEAFNQVSESSSKVRGLVAEFVAASNEQAGGVDQVNKAVAEMDKVVQQNAANAEESASATEAMSSQAVQMRKVVNKLARLINGKGKKMFTPGSNSPHSIKRLISQAAHQSIQKGQHTAFQLERPRVQCVKKPRPDQIIPFDEEDFEDF